MMKRFNFFLIFFVVGIFLLTGFYATQNIFAAEEEKILYFNSSGGMLQKAQQKAYFDFYTKDTGIKVIYSSPSNFAKLKMMVESGNIEWDITELPMRDYVRAVRDGLLEPVDWSVIDPNNEIPKEYQLKWAYPGSAYSTIFAYRTVKYSKENHPKTWSEFWDVKKFPGPRSLRNNPVDNLEFALMADGVPKDNLYPLDIERAFKSLDKIKPHIAVWWTAGAQPPQLLSDGEVEFTTAWNGRITTIKKEGAPVEIEWNQGLLKVSRYGIPKGAKHKKNAMLMLKYMARAEGQAISAKMTGYTGFNKRLGEFLDPETAKNLCTYPENAKVQAVQNAKWWLENADKVTEMWQSWKLE
jgi:putative spermidine/putrescine transport system substrate-binding protein